MPAARDWHPEDIKAALRKRGWSFSRIAREHGYAMTSPRDVLRRKWSQVETIVAEIVGVPAAKIWPSRYGNRRRARRDRRSGTDRRIPQGG